MDSQSAAAQTIRAAKLSVLSNSVLTAAKLAVGFAIGSVSVIAEGIHSGNDLVASLIAWFAVRKSSEPPDSDHGYGHGKFESLSALIEAGLIVVAAAAVVWAAVGRLLGETAPEIRPGWGLVVMALSAAANIAVSTYLYRVARRHQSIALKADATHLRADVFTSSGVLLGLILIHFTGQAILDPIVAVLVGFLILFQGGRIGWEALGQLVDRSLPADEVDRIVALLGEHDDLFMDYHRLRTRRSGRERQVDLHLVTCQMMTVKAAHDVCDHLERDVARDLPSTRLTIHVEPCDDADCPNRRASTRDPQACVRWRERPR